MNARRPVEELTARGHGTESGRCRRRAWPDGPPHKRRHRGSRKLLTLPHNPTTCSSQTQTQITTTTFRIDLMLEAMGIYLLIRYKATPTTTSTTTRFSRGILYSFAGFKSNPKAQAREPYDQRRRPGARRPGNGFAREVAEAVPAVPRTIRLMIFTPAAIPALPEKILHSLSQAGTCPRFPATKHSRSAETPAR
jgi:hypothetical protein